MSPKILIVKPGARLSWQYHHRRAEIWQVYKGEVGIVRSDKDRTVCETIRMIAENYGLEYDLAFANGGDQYNDTIPEQPICEEVGITLIDGLGDKIQSSSWLLKND